MKLLQALVVQDVGLLHHQVLDGVVGVLLEESVTGYAANNLQRKITHDHRILVLFSGNLVHGEGSLQLPEPEFRVLIIEQWDWELEVRCPDCVLTLGLSSWAKGAGAGVAPTVPGTREDGSYRVMLAVFIITGSSPREGDALQDTQ